MFETWLKQEKETIRERFGKSRIWCIFLALLMLPLALLNLIMLLDGGGVLQFGAFLFMIVVALLILFLGNYKRRLIKPLMASVKKNFPPKRSVRNLHGRCPRRFASRTSRCRR